MNALDPILFYFFAALAVGAAALMVTRRNLLHAAMWMTATLLATAGIFLQLQADFLFIVQIFLLAGAVMGLFVFTIRSLRLKPREASPKIKRRTLIATALALVLAAQIWFAIAAGRTSLRLPEMQANIPAQNTDALGNSLFHAFVVPFGITSVLLLVAMIGATLMWNRRA
jgi:NADH-quinone oxidoreductase subunit J